MGRSEEEIDAYNSVVEQLLRMNRSDMGAPLGINIKTSTNGHKQQCLK
jgi:hypothetical protein